MVYGIMILLRTKSILGRDIQIFHNVSQSKGILDCGRSGLKTDKFLFSPLSSRVLSYAIQDKVAHEN